jgi:hypothetical protein
MVCEQKRCDSHGKQPDALAREEKGRIQPWSFLFFRVEHPPESIRPSEEKRPKQYERKGEKKGD